MTQKPNQKQLREERKLSYVRSCQEVKQLKTFEKNPPDLAERSLSLREKSNTRGVGASEVSTA